ncbi:hypothetical protein QFZ30_002485 [Arthrobacter pascens]|uniref:hypothetical protein n=1 Tax=Arthrobacter pascens TaxID=1677 RepID=UPI00278EF38D|nr:hypothetical protein [Arthrobacter pascens]MDQ0679103.1 hypothetical protein [Arthrobacter pascens]
MTKHYRSIINITGLDDIDIARSFALGGVQDLAEQDGIILSEDDVIGRTTLGRYEKEGKTYLQAILTTD